jgi:hypothetical protein
METRLDCNSDKIQGSIDEEELWAPEPLLLSYAKWVGEPDSLLSMPGFMGDLWIMRCPLRGHSGKVRTFILDLRAGRWICTACATHGDVVDVAARINRLGRREGTQIIELYRQRMARSAR